jgi:hypothetical protein
MVWAVLSKNPDVTFRGEAGLCSEDGRDVRSGQLICGPKKDRIGLLDFCLNIFMGG